MTHFRSINKCVGRNTISGDVAVVIAVIDMMVAVADHAPTSRALSGLSKIKCGGRTHFKL
jgi:hypothetical protein